MPWRRARASQAARLAQGAPRLGSCQARPHGGRADRGPRTRGDGRASDPGARAGRGRDPRRRGRDLRHRPTAREPGHPRAEGPRSRGGRRPAGRDRGRRPAERGLRAMRVVRARSREPMPRPRGHRDPARRRPGGVDRRARGPRCPARRVPVRSRTLDRTARVLLARGGDARRGDGEVAVVVGAGTLGIIGMWALQAAGARVRSCNGPRLDDVSRPSSAHTRCSNPGTTSPRRRVLPGAALVTAPGVEALSWAIEHVDVGGRVHAFAGTPGGAPVDANIVHYRHLRLVGSTGSTVDDYRARATWPARVPSRSSGLPSRTVTLRMPRICSTTPPILGCCGSW